MKNRIKKWLPLLLAVMMTAALFAVPVSADSTAASYPNVSHMKIDGTPVVGQTLTFSYDLYDPSSKDLAADKATLDAALEWERWDTPYVGAMGAAAFDKAVKVVGKGTSYEIQAEDVGKYIAVRVPVKSATSWVRIRSIGAGPILAADADLSTPSASTVTIEHPSSSVGAVVGEPLEGHYLYAGAKAKGACEYQWAVSGNYNPDNDDQYTPIEGATDKTYTPTVADAGKWLRFTVTPVDADGTKGEPVHSVTRPAVGNAAFGAAVTGTQNVQHGMMLNTLTNGVINNGGSVYTYNGASTNDSVIDLGEVRVIDSMKFNASQGTDADGVKLFSSLTGEKTDFTPIHTADYTGEATEGELIAFKTASGTAAFSKPIQARFIQLNVNKVSTGVALQMLESAFYEALPTGLTAAAKESTTLQVEENATEAEVREALADKLTVTAAYSGDVSYEIPLSSAKIELNTATGGMKGMKVSYKGQEATVSVQVGSSAAVTGLTVTKPADHVNTLTVFTGATDDEVRSVIDGVYTIKATRSDSTEVTLKAKDVEIALDREAAGTGKTCTLTYGGQTATITGIKVADKKQPPSIYGLWIEGTPVAGETLTLHYTLDDPDNVVGGAAAIGDAVIWHRVPEQFGINRSYYDNMIDAASNPGFAVQKKGLTYTIPADSSMVGQYIDAAIGLKGSDVLPTTGWDRKTAVIGPILSEKSTTPAASTVTISSMGMNGGRGVGANVGQALRGEYYYVGATAEGESTYQWYSSSSETTGFTAIAGATQREYTVQESDRGKYLKFTVTPKDEAGAAGTAVDSINRPMAGNAAYLAMATTAGFSQANSNGGVQSGANTQVLTNGISDGKAGAGGAIYIFRDNTNVFVDTATVDLGKVQTITGARLAVHNKGNDINTVDFYTSPDGLYWYPAETTEAEQPLLKDFATSTVPLGKAVTFKEAAQGRYVQIRFTREGGPNISELQAFVQETAPELQSIAATAKDSAVLAVKQGAAAADVQAYLAENVTVTATYAGGTDPVALVAEAPVTYTLDTSAAGAAVNATVSFLGKTTTIPVKVEAPEVESITVTKAQDVDEIKVPLNADAAALKSLLKDKVVITANYVGGSTATIPGEDAEYSATTTAAGTVNATVSYGGQTATVSITVEGKALTGITVAKTASVTGDINVWQNTQDLKAALADKIVITANYSDSSTETVNNAEATYTGSTATVGKTNVTVSWGGKEATVEINVQAVTLTGITVDKAQNVTEIKVPMNTTAEGLKSLLADKIVITGTYSDNSTKTIANADANYSGSTATAGAAEITVSYGGKNATISVTVEAEASLTGITVAKANGVTEIKVPLDTDAAGLKALLADKIVITEQYSDGTEKSGNNADATYSADTSKEGTVNVTVTYKGQTAAISVTVAVPEVDPSLFGMHITGTPVVGETLTFEYDLYDPKNKESNIVSKIDWQLQNAPDYLRKADPNNEESLSKGSATYTIPNDTEIIGKYISVNVQMTGLSNNGRCRTMAVGPILAAAPSAPTASSVSIVPAPGSAKAGCDTNQALMGNYLYAGAQPEGGSTYQWYRANSETGTFTAIEGATEQYYTPTDADWGKYLQFRVTPVDTTGATGEEASSYNVPRVGDAAYKAYVSGDAGAYAGCSYQSLTNGVYAEKGGGIFTYGYNQSKPSLIFMTVDLGAVRTLEGVRLIYGNANEKDGVTLQISRTGEEGTFTTVHTEAETDSADFEGEKITLKSNFDNGDVMFTEPVTGRYVKIGITRYTNVRVYEMELLSKQDKAPVLTLNGEKEMKLLRGEPYVEPGFTATDEEDGNLTANVVVTGTDAVDTNTVGTYEITYAVTDSRPQTITVVRRVSVADGYKEDGDLAYGQTVTADGENAASLVDGNKFTYWQAGSVASSAVIDLGSEQKVSNAVLIEEDSAVTGYVIEVSANGSSWQTAYTGTTIGARQSVDFDPVSGRYVRLRFTGASAAPKMATFEIRYDDLGKAKEAAEALILEGNLDALTEDLALPEKGLNGAVITWSSDNVAAISSRGIVHRSEAGDQYAVLTATITVGEASVTKTFPVTVLRRTGGNSGNTGGFGGGGSGGRNDSSTIQIPTTQPNIPNNQPGSTTGKFKDVPDSHWAKNFIENLGSKGIVGGREDGTFDAEGAVTRAEFLKMIVEIFNLKADAPASAFTDVAEGDWYYSYVSTAAALGVAQGMGDGSFGAGAPITRQDMAVLVARAAAVAEKDLGEAGDLDRFTDAAQVGDYASTALSQLVGAGIVGGDDKGALNPANNATRAEAAKILYLVSDLVQA